MGQGSGAHGPVLLQFDRVPGGIIDPNLDRACPLDRPLVRDLPVFEFGDGSRGPPLRCRSGSRSSRSASSGWCTDDVQFLIGHVEPMAWDAWDFRPFLCLQPEQANVERDHLCSVVSLQFTDTW